MRQIVYAVLTRAPVVSEVQALPVTPRLACIRPAASVHPEPGSNSSLLNFKYYLTTKEIKFYLLMMVYSLKLKINLIYAVNQFQYFNEHKFFSASLKAGVQI